MEFELLGLLQEIKIPLKISESVTSLVGQNNNLSDFSEGYNNWKEAWDSGKGGYWTVDLKDAIEGMDSVMRQNK